MAHFHSLQVIMAHGLFYKLIVAHCEKINCDTKSLKKVNLIYISNPVPFNKQDYAKQKGPGTCEQLRFMLQNKFRKIPSLVMYYLAKFDDVI